MFEECLLGVLSMVWCTFTRSYTRKGSTFSASLSWYAGRGSKNRNRSSPGDCYIPRCAHWGIPLFLPQAEMRTSTSRRSGAALLPRATVQPLAQGRPAAVRCSARRQFARANPRDCGIGIALWAIVCLRQNRRAAGRLCRAERFRRVQNLHKKSEF